MERFEFDHEMPIQGVRGGLLVSRGIGGHELRHCPDYELIFVRAGELHMQEEDRRFTVRAGETLLLWPERRHWGTRDYPADLEYFWLHFSIPRVSIKEGEITAGTGLVIPQQVTVRRPDFLESLLRRFLDDQETHRLNPLTSGLLVWLMLTEIAEQSAMPGGAGASAVIAGRAEDYIRTHFHLPLTASRIAAEMPCNPQYLSRVYRQTYRQTLTEAIHRVRLGYAQHLLMHTNRSVGEIGRACGLEDTSYFLKLFKRYTGMTALAFRRLNARSNVITE
jgi:AraC-like DNA-binding protein